MCFVVAVPAKSHKVGYVISPNSNPPVYVMNIASPGPAKLAENNIGFTVIKMLIVYFSMCLHYDSNKANKNNNNPMNSSQ